MINEGLLEILLLAQHKADPKLAQHCKRVACYALEIAKALHQDTVFKKKIFIGGLVHDIGFLKLSTSFSQVSMSMTLHRDTDFIHSHVLEGEELIAKVLNNSDILSMIRHHHERYDGNGYPDRLTGDEIPLMVRILAVANLYDTLLIGEMSNEERNTPEFVAHYFVTQASGSYLDPRIVEIFLELLQKNPVFYLAKDKNPLDLYQIVYLKPGILTLGDLVDQNETVLVGEGSELTQHILDNIRSTYPGQKIIHAHTPDDVTLDKLIGSHNHF